MKVGTSTIAFAISAILIGAAPLAARAQTATADVATAPGKVRAKETIKMTATVLSIDMGSRDVLLMDSQGKLHTVNVSDQARNLDQVRVGDKVTAEYTEAISLQLKKRGTAAGPPASAEEAMIRSPKGAKPGGAVGRKVTAIASVVAVNPKKQFVTLRGPLGNEYDVQVLDPVQLKAVKEGDEVEVVYTEALAISVQSTPNSQ
jgi:Cu/Ag efflux protein CusF